LKKLKSTKYSDYEAAVAEIFKMKNLIRNKLKNKEKLRSDS
jgi:hypothetical protein